jgi:hypothetical protein
MADRVILASFDNAETAAHAERELATVGGVAPAAISRHAQKGAPAHHPSEQSAGGLWDWLLGEESPVRDASIYRRSAEGGGALLAVTVAEADAGRVASLLRRMGPSSVEEHPARV